MKQNLSTNFVPYNDSEFIIYARFIHLSMEDNPFFTNPVPPLNLISQLINEFSESLAEAGMKGKPAIVTKNVLRKKLEHQLGRLALYVMYVADDNQEILVSSGYHLTKKPTANKLEEPQQPTLVSGLSSGQIVSMIKAVKGARYYLHEISPEPLTNESVWESHSCSRRKYVFENLKPGQKYWVRITALGTDKQKVYSPAAGLWAQ